MLLAPVAQIRVETRTRARDLPATRSINNRRGGLKYDLLLVRYFGIRGKDPRVALARNELILGTGRLQGSTRETYYIL